MWNFFFRAHSFFRFPLMLRIVILIADPSLTQTQLSNRGQYTFDQNCLISFRVHYAVNAYYFACSSCGKAPPNHNASSAMFNCWHWRVRQTYSLSFLPKWSSLVSSDHKTFCHNISSLLIWALVYLSWACLCFFVSSGFLRRILPWRPASFRSQRTADVFALIPTLARQTWKDAEVASRFFMGLPK